MHVVFPVSGLSEKRSRKDSSPFRGERSLEALIINIFIKNRITEIVSESIPNTQITETISRTSASVTFITEQDPYNLFIAITKWSFIDCSMNFIPAKSFSLSELHFNIPFRDFFSDIVPAKHFTLPEFYYNILVADFFSKFLWKCLYQF